MIIRKEKKSEYNDIYNLIKEAFKTALVSDDNEQNYANSLRETNNYIPSLALVAEENDELIGHIMLTKMQFKKINKKIKALLLGPISVKLENRNQGVGSELIKTSFNLAEKLGYDCIILVGNPKYYNRFGFVKSTYYDIKNCNDIPDEFVMIYELRKGALSSVEGIVSFY